MKSDLVIEVPTFVSPTTLANSLRDVPIVAKGDSLRAYFEPPAHISQITLNTGGLLDGTAEGLCAVLAFRAWLGCNTPPTAELLVKPPPATSGLDADLRGLQFDSWEPAPGRTGFLPIRVEVPDDPIDGEGPAHLVCDGFSARPAAIVAPSSFATGVSVARRVHR